MRDPRQRDWWLYPVEVKTGVNDKFRINETGGGGAGQITVTIPEGKYYTHRSTKSPTYPFRSLYKTIEGLLAATAATNGYAFESATPTLSPSQVGNGIKITNPIIEWRIEWPSDSIEKKWFGLTNHAGNVASVDNGGIWEITSGHTVAGRWRSTGLGNIDGIATRKRKNPKITSQWSHDRPSDRRGIVWHKDNEYAFEYQYVLAGQIYEDAANLASYAEVAGLAAGDSNAVFEHLWYSMAKGENVLCIHDDDGWDGTITYANRFINSHTMQNLGNISLTSAISMRALQGEAYDIQLNTFVVHGTEFF